MADKPMEEALRGGSETCPRPCSECGVDHHFGDAMIDFADFEPDHPAAIAGCDAWYACKHCEAWREVVDEDLEDELEDETVLPRAPPKAAPRGAQLRLLAVDEAEEDPGRHGREE